MWQTRAVLSLLRDDVAELRRPPDDVVDEPFPTAIRRAARRAKLAILVDWTAIAALLVASDAGGPALTLGHRVETLLTLGLLAIAVHSGFRLGQLQKYRAVARAGRGLLERDPEASRAAPPG